MRLARLLACSRVAGPPSQESYLSRNSLLRQEGCNEVGRVCCPGQLAPKPVPKAAAKLGLHADTAASVTLETGGLESLQTLAWLQRCPRVPK